MGWREVIASAATAAIAWNDEGDLEVNADTLREKLDAIPTPDRIALARELLEGTGRVVAERKLLEAARACMRETGWHLAPGAIARGSDGILEMACAEVEQQFAAMLADDAGDG